MTIKVTLRPEDGKGRRRSVPGGAALTPEAEALPAACQALRDQVDACAQERSREPSRPLWNLRPSACIG